MVQPAEHGLEHVASYIIEKDRDYYYAVPGSRGVPYVAPSTDAKTVIQNAGTAIQTAGGGEIIIKGPTTYSINPTSISDTLTPAGAISKIRFKGIGYPTLQLTPGVARPLINKGAGAIDFTLEGLIFDGNKTNQTDSGIRSDGELVRVVGSTSINSRIRVKDCLFKNARIGAALNLGGTDVRVIDSHFIDNGVGGAAFTTDHMHWETVDSGVIDHCYFKNCTDTAMAMDTCNKAAVANTTAIDADGTLMTWADLSSGSLGLTIDNCHFEQINYADECLIISDFGGPGGGKEVTITNSIFKNLQTSATNGSLIEHNASSKLAINNCILTTKITDPAKAAIDLSLNSGAEADIEINNCLFELAHGGVRAIVMRNLTDFNISHNVFKTVDTGFRLISVSSTKGIISDNMFDDVTTPLSYGIAPDNVRIQRNTGYNPIGLVATPFRAATTDIAPWGSTSSLSASTDYNIDGTDCFLTSTGGTGVSITIKDLAGNTIESGLTTLTNKWLPYGFKINFGAFSGAPTVTVWAN